MTVETFTTPGTFTGLSGWLCPSGVTRVVVHVWGAGGGSGHGQALVGRGRGGGGGAYSRKLVIVIPGQRYDFQVGTGGLGGAVLGAAGAAGTDSWFVSAATVMAKAGGGGPAAANNPGGQGGLASAGVGDVKFSGGNASNNAGGGGGGSAGSDGNGGNADTNTGGLAGVGDYPGAAGTSSDGTPGDPGVAPGGGAAGGGNSNSSTGAQGGHGRIVLEYDADTITYPPGAGTLLRAPALILGGQEMLLGNIDGAEVWKGMVEFTLEFDPALVPYTFVVPPRCTQLRFEGTGARGGAGADDGATPGPGTTVGGKGGYMEGRLAVTEGDIVTVFVGNEGGPGWLSPFGAGGEPGGVCSQLNIFGSEERQLGGCGGGLSAIFLNFEPVVVIGGGGGGGADSPTSSFGGNGGVGGGLTAGAGHDGIGSSANKQGHGGLGGSQVAGGVGGVGGNSGNGAGTGTDGIYLAGGATFRRGIYGAGVVPHSCGGGGGGGWFGGGGGGNGSTNTSPGGAGGGGGGSSYFEDAICNLTLSQKGVNDGPGSLTIRLLAPYDWTPPL